MFNLKEKLGEQIDTDITLDEYIDFNHDVTTTRGKLSDREILAEIIGRQEEDSDKDEDENDDMLWSLKEINRGVDKEEQCTKRKVPVTDFSKK